MNISGHNCLWISRFFHFLYLFMLLCCYLISVSLNIEGNCFVGDATKCFKGTLSKEENLKLAEAYWESEADGKNPQAICEMLVNGRITVVEIVKEINANIEVD